MSRQLRPSKTGSSGFTIIELLIATAVFSVVLLVVTTGVLRFTRQYYQGAISSETQNVARQLANDVAQSIQFSPGSVYELRRLKPSDSGAPPSPVVGYCVGQSNRYSFVLNQEVTDGGSYDSHQGAHALIADTTSGCSTATMALDASKPSVLTAKDPNTGQPPRNAHELLGASMRLVKFSVTPTTTGGLDNAYDITVRVVYGDDAVLCSPSANTCTQGAASPNKLNGRDDIECKPGAGNQFCAVAEFTTTVKKRVN